MDPKNPVIGQLVIDGSELAAFVVDLPPGACAGMVSTREGFADVCKELMDNQAQWGVKAGIPAEELTEITTINEQIALLNKFRPVYAKALEMLDETYCKLDDRRQRIVLNGAKSVDRRLDNTPELGAIYEKTRVYRSAAAKKAVKTRARNAELKKSAAEATPKNTPPTPQ